MRWRRHSMLGGLVITCISQCWVCSLTAHDMVCVMPTWVVLSLDDRCTLRVLALDHRSKLLGGLSRKDTSVRLAPALHVDDIHGLLPHAVTRSEVMSVANDTPKRAASYVPSNDHQEL
jgi:hypothetical protein